MCSQLPVVAEGLAAIYAQYEVLPPDAQEFVDFHIEIAPGRRFPKPQCIFKIDGEEPFTPLAAGEAFALFEWGLNWCVTGYCHTWITIHSAVLERHGKTVLLPAPPGSGKSTLCAALMLDGWRLLSDEMALLNPRQGTIQPFPRPVSLKNQSIEVIRQRAPNVVMGPVAFDTMKGNVAHLQVSPSSLERANEVGTPHLLVFPRYVAGSSTELLPRGKANSLMHLAENSFNQQVHGREGFKALSALIDRVDCYDFSYSNVDEALAVFSQLAGSQ